VGGWGWDGDIKTLQKMVIARKYISRMKRSLEDPPVIVITFADMITPIPFQRNLHSLITHSKSMQAKNVASFFANCVYVNTAFFSFPATVVNGDKASIEFDRFAGEKVAQKERLVAGSLGHKTSTARLEHRPGFTGELGIAAAQGAGL
jgi:hypothetical protein